MKKSLLLLGCLISCSELMAQEYRSVTQSFESNYKKDTIVKIEEMTGDWQIGMPKKSVYNSANTGFGAAVTDTSKPYSGNTISKMKVLFNKKPFTNHIVVKFSHKLDISDGIDSAKIEFSFDKGVKWLNLNESQTYLSCVGGYLYSSNKGTFSKTIIDWKEDFYSISTLTLVRSESCGVFGYLYGLDALMIRFSFFSNTTNPTKDGWMIDDLKIEEDAYSGIQFENIHNNANISLAPNPANGENVSLVSLDPNLKVKGWILEDMQGVQLKKQSYVTEIQTQNLQKGMYIVKVETDKGWYSKKLVVR